MESVKKEAEIFFRGEFVKMAIDHDNINILINGIIKFIDNPVDDLTISVDGDKLTADQIQAVKKLIFSFRDNMAAEVWKINNPGKLNCLKVCH